MTLPPELLILPFSLVHPCTFAMDNGLLIKASQDDTGFVTELFITRYIAVSHFSFDIIILHPLPNFDVVVSGYIHPFLHTKRTATSTAMSCYKFRSLPSAKLEAQTQIFLPLGC